MLRRVESADDLNLGLAQVGGNIAQGEGEQGIAANIDALQEADVINLPENPGPSKKKTKIAKVKADAAVPANTLCEGSVYDYGGGEEDLELTHSEIVDRLSGATAIAASYENQEKADFYYEVSRNQPPAKRDNKKPGGNPTNISGLLSFRCTSVCQLSKEAIEWRTKNPPCSFCVDFSAQDSTAPKKWHVSRAHLPHSCGFPFPNIRSKPMRTIATTAEGMAVLAQPLGATRAGERKNDATLAGTTEAAKVAHISLSMLGKSNKRRLAGMPNQHYGEFTYLAYFLQQYLVQDPAACIQLLLKPLGYEVKDDSGRAPPAGAMQFVGLSIIPGAMVHFLKHSAQIDTQDAAHCSGIFGGIISTTVRFTHGCGKRLIVTHLSLYGRETKASWLFHREAELSAKSDAASDLCITDQHLGLTTTEHSKYSKAFRADAIHVAKDAGSGHPQEFTQRVVAWARSATPEGTWCTCLPVNTASPHFATTRVLTTLSNPPPPKQLPLFTGRWRSPYVRIRRSLSVMSILACPK